MPSPVIARPAGPWQSRVGASLDCFASLAMTANSTGQIKLHQSWLEPLRGEFDEPYMADLKRFLAAQREAGKRIFPKGTEWFRALDLTPLEKVRVVILGQDPYHGEG